ncbi:hypothetical protein ACIQVE_00170, partial [Pseudomonas sp. NPDC098747]|uniref:hypothetical protein n=1 Tax=Pseudomonas sp. NPDC098747 TaxID=3364487 RepID=UPI00383AD47E
KNKSTNHIYNLNHTQYKHYTHTITNSAQLFRFSALQFTNEAPGHLNHKPADQYMPLLAAGLGPINGLGPC